MPPKPFKPPTRVSQPSSNTARPTIPNRNASAAVQSLRENPMFRGFTSSIESLDADDENDPKAQAGADAASAARLPHANANDSNPNANTNSNNPNHSANNKNTNLSAKKDTFADADAYDAEMQDIHEITSSPPLPLPAPTSKAKGKQAVRSTARARGGATAGGAASSRARGAARGSKRRQVYDSDDESSADNQKKDALPPPGRPADPPNELGEPHIPRKLLSKLIHDSFEHAETRITADAMTVLHRYIDLFAKEAVMRAIQEREQRDGHKGGFLSIEELEMLTPQLLLDFAGF